MRLEELKKYKKILIVGRGIEGASALQFLKKFHKEAKIDVVDKKDGANYLAYQNNYDLVIKSPGVKKELIKAPYTTPTNIFFANVLGNSIGVTGTKGKSTTVSLIDAILKKQGIKSRLVGNIGNAMLSELLLSNSKDDVFVIELSSYQLDDIKYSPHISVITNLYQGHIDYHRGLDKYWRSKLNIIKYATTNDYFVYNSKFQILQKAAATASAKPIKIDEEKQVENLETSLLGSHNRDNINAAVCVARLFKIKDETIISAISDFRPLPHRLENIGKYHGIVFVDDAISTTPESTIAALKTIENVDTIFLGGSDPGYDFSSLVEEIKNKEIRNMVLFPDSGKKILSAIPSKMRSNLNILSTDSMEEAVIFAFKNTKQGGVCLLSTACPSYSLWRNYLDKAADFQKNVEKYGKKKKEN